MKAKVLLSLVAVFVCCCCVVGGTVAWLTVRVSVENTFVVGNISISLTETTGNSYQLVPGSTIAKDPRLTVNRESAECWIFVKIQESNGLSDYVNYTIADGWTELSEGIYYRSYNNINTTETYSIIENNEVTVKDTLTEAQLSALKVSGAYPTLKVKAYAVQKSGISGVEEAWEKVNQF